MHEDKHRQRARSILDGADLSGHHLRVLLCTDFYISRYWSCGNIFQVCVFNLICSSVPMNRYQYYLQVKKDVLEGRLRCPLEQVIRLAGLAVQGKECDGRPVKSHFLFDCGAAGLSEGKNGIFLNDPLVTLTFHSKILEKCRSGKKKKAEIVIFFFFLVAGWWLSQSCLQIVHVCIILVLFEETAAFILPLIKATFKVCGTFSQNYSTAQCGHTLWLRVMTL